MDMGIKTPDLGTTEDHVKVVRWLVKPGAEKGSGVFVAQFRNNEHKRGWNIKGSRPFFPTPHRSYTVITCRTLI